MEGLNAYWYWFSGYKPGLKTFSFSFGLTPVARQPNTCIYRLSG
jgi:hypothetical protein